MMSLVDMAPDVVLFHLEVTVAVVIPLILLGVIIHHLVIAVVTNPLPGAIASAPLVGGVSPTTMVVVEAVIDLRDAFLPQPMTTPLLAAADMVDVVVAMTTLLRETAMDTTMIIEVRMGRAGGITMNPIEDVRTSP